MSPRPRTPEDWGDPDPEEVLARRDPEPSRRDRLRRGVRQLVLFGLAATVLAGIGGFLLARSAPEVAAQLLVRDVVAEEPPGSVTDGPAPTSVATRVPVLERCGDRDEPMAVEEQRRAVFSGVVVVQARDEAVLGELRDWAAGEDAPLLTAPNPDLESPVVATAWARRMRLEDVNTELLGAFVIAHGRMAPELAAC